MLMAALGFLLIATPAVLLHTYNQPASQTAEQTTGDRYYSQHNANAAVIPVVTVSLDTTNKTVKADDAHTTTTTWDYLVVASTDTCDSNTDFANATSYTEGQSVGLLYTHDLSRFCFRSTDDTQSGYGLSDIVDIPTMPDITIVLDMTNKTIKADDDHTVATTWDYIVTTAPCISSADFANATNYTEGQLIDLLPAHHQNSICFRSVEVDQYGYNASTILDTMGPDIVITNPDTSPASSKTISADATDIDYDPANFTYKLFDPSSETCDQQLMSSGTTTGSTVTLTNASANDQQVCFSVFDDNHNTSYKASATIGGLGQTVTPPATFAITTSQTVDHITAVDDSAVTNTWHYLITTSNQCGSSTDFASAVSYQEAEQIEINHSADHGQYFCFRAVDSSDKAAYASEQIVTRPTIVDITSNVGSGVWGLGREYLIAIVFSEDVVVNKDGSPISTSDNRSFSIETNIDNDDATIIHHTLNVYWNNSGTEIEFVYTPRRGDYTVGFLDVVALVARQGVTVTDTDGNQAILAIPPGVNLDNNVDIAIDARVTTISLSHSPDFDLPGANKSVSAVDDYVDNDNIPGNTFPGADYYAFEYYFIPAELANSYSDVDVECATNVFDISDRHSYTEGQAISLSQIHNDSYLCFRSRRGNQRLHDRYQDKDWGKAVSQLIHSIDDQGPVITFGYFDNQVTPTVSDDSGVNPSSLWYKIVEATSDCGLVNLETGATSYVNQQAIDVAAEHFYDVFCFGAADTYGNRRQVAFYPFQDASDITVTRVSTSQADGVYGLARQIDIQLIFSAAVQVSGQPQLELNSGGVANYLAGHGSQSLTFNYQVANGQDSADLDVVRILLNGGSISGLNGNQVELKLTANNLASGHDLVVDTSPPAIQVSPLADSQVSAIATDSLSEVVDMAVQILANNITCNQQTTGQFTDYTPAESISLSANQKACFRAADAAGNLAYASSVTTDSSAPVITVNTNINRVIATDDDALATTWHYRLVTAGRDCSAASFRVASHDYQEGYKLVIRPRSAVQVCFRSVDAQDNQGYALSQTIQPLPVVTKPIPAAAEPTPPPAVPIAPSQTTAVEYTNIEPDQDSRFSTSQVTGLYLILVSLALYIFYRRRLQTEQQKQPAKKNSKNSKR